MIVDLKSLSIQLSLVLVFLCCAFKSRADEKNEELRKRPSSLEISAGDGKNASSSGTLRANLGLSPKLQLKAGYAHTKVESSSDYWGLSLGGQYYFFRGTYLASTIGRSKVLSDFFSSSFGIRGRFLMSDDWGLRFGLLGTRYEDRFLSARSTERQVQLGLEWQALGAWLLYLESKHSGFSDLGHILDALVLPEQTISAGSEFGLGIFTFIAEIQRSRYFRNAKSPVTSALLGVDVEVYDGVTVGAEGSTQKDYSAFAAWIF